MEQIAMLHVLNRDRGRNPAADGAVSAGHFERTILMHLKTILSVGLLAIASHTSSAHAQDANVGVMSFSFDAAHRERLVQSLIFYPAENGGMPEWTGDNAVFKGVRLQREAKPLRAAHPLLVISHGSGGNAQGLAWLAKRLALEGYIVAVPNHQGSTSADSTPETTIPAVWERPADLTRLIDAMSASGSVKALFDENDITAIGFSLGGVATLKLAGVTFDAGKLADFCDAQPDSMGCPWLAKGNALIPGHVDLRKIDARKFNTSSPDQRFKRIVAIDPGFAPAVNMESLGGVSAQVQIINLGDEDTMPEGVDARHIASAIPQGRHELVTGASHFDFLPECKTFGWFLIWLEGDDPVCSQTGHRARSEIHEEAAEKILSFLKVARGV
jgi:predicted dienelactone hydrolase